VTVWIWNRRTDFHHSNLVEHVRNASNGWTQYQADLSVHGITGNGAFQYVDRIIGGQAATLAVNDVFFALGCMFIVLVPFIWLARSPFTGGRGGAAH
jgi:MFS transporter, DHA2 family, multidrug resistance protein